MKRRNRMPYSLSVISDANPQGLAQLPPELYIPLWWYSGGSVTQSGVPSANSNYALSKGSTTLYAYNKSQAQLFTLNSSWPASVKYAVEATLWNSGTNTIYAELWDINSNTPVVGSQISSPSTTATVVRSGSFTLTPGHSYALIVWSSGTGYITDASLIVFPNQQLLAQGSLANITLGVVGQKLAEAQIPLWVYSSGSVSTSSGNVALISKGSTSVTAPTSSATPANKLFTLSSSWSASQNFALEISAWMSNANVNSAYVYLWDITTNVQVSNINISSSVTTAALVRSGSFKLTPTHSYGVGITTANGNSSCNLTKAHLVPLFS